MEIMYTGTADTQLIIVHIAFEAREYFNLLKRTTKMSDTPNSIIKTVIKSTVLSIATNELSDDSSQQQELLMQSLVTDDVNFFYENAAVVGLLEEKMENDTGSDHGGVGVRDFVKVTVPAYSNLEFRQHFRMTRECFEMLVLELQPLLEVESSTSVDVALRLLLTLWTLGNQESFRQIADRFDVNRGTAYYYFTQVCNAIVKLKEKYVVWPSEQERAAVSSGFKFPFTYGAIDGSHIQIKAPLQHLPDYTNRKMFTSVVLQAVCDSRMVFTNISVGWPGSLHDARIFKKSSLSTILENDPDQQYHLLGDSAYPLSSKLLVPYKDNGHLSARQIHYNIQQSSSRTVIERAFALLKGKFRRLKYLDMSKLEFIPTVITTACVLHNFILLNNAASSDIGDLLEPGDASDVVMPLVGNANEDIAGKMKRDVIAGLLHGGPAN